MPTPDAPFSFARDHGRLPDWQTGDLPEPLPLTGRNILRTIGPGAILLAGSIGGGGGVIGPLVGGKFGTPLLWGGGLALLLPMTFQPEAVPDTVFSRGPILAGVMRLDP